MFGQRATLSINFDTSKTTPQERADQYVQMEEGDFEERLQVREKQLEEAKTTLWPHSRDLYDRKHANPERYHVGALVLKKKINFLYKKKKKGGKLDERFTGPYKISKFSRMVPT